MMSTQIGDPIERILRIPLTLKLILANTALLGVAVAFTAWALGDPWSGSEAVGSPGRPGVLLGIAVGTILLGTAVNTVVVRIALSPLRTLEETAMQVDAGREEARAGSSAIADPDLQALMDRFDAMLDSLGEARSRQQAAAFRLVESEERLRGRIAGTLYGDVGQRLAAILLVIGRAVRTDRSATDSDAGPARTSPLGDVQSEIADVLEIIRGTARSLRPPELDDLGVMAAIQAEIRTLTARSPVPVVLRDAPPDLALPEHEGLVFFRLIQEGLGVVLEESTPTRVELTIRTTDDSIRCDIEAKRTEAGKTARIGGGLPDSVLEPMRERAGWIGGRITVVERAPGDPRLRVEVPASPDGIRGRPTAFAAPVASASRSFPDRWTRPA